MILNNQREMCHVFLRKLFAEPVYKMYSKYAFLCISGYGISTIGLSRYSDKQYNDLLIKLPY